MPRGGPVYRHAVVKTPKRDEALVASSRVYQANRNAEKLNRTGKRSQSRGWQNELWDFYDIVPEFRFACDWVGNLLSKAKLYVNEDDKRSENQHALDAIASLFGGPEGQEEMLRLLGINFTVAGEAYIIGDEGQDGDSWRVAAATEVSAEAGGGSIKVEDEALDPDALAIRLWKAHPRVSSEANSPARAVLPTLGQIVKLGMVIDAQADSRLTNAGILWIPSEIDLPTMPVVVEDENGDEVVTQTSNAAGAVTQQLIQIGRLAIQDRDSAAAQIPLVIAAEGQYLEKIQHTSFWSGFDEHAQELRSECVQRVGIGMDMPPEVLTGTADMNHWGSWQVEEAAIKAHSEPLLNVIVASLTTGYLHPYLEAMGVENFKAFTFEVDTAALRLRPNRSKEAIELYDRGILNKKTLLVENGFDPESDLMDDQEVKLWYLRKVASGSTTPEQVSAALGLLGVLGIPSSSPKSTEAPSTRSLEGHPVREIPTEDDSESKAVTASASFIIDPILLAAEQMVHRALERAGNRLKNQVGRNVGGFASDLYLSVPQPSASEAEELLADAWVTCERFSYPGVSSKALQDALHGFTLATIRLQRPYSREALARHLLLELG